MCFCSSPFQRFLIAQLPCRIVQVLRAEILRLSCVFEVLNVLVLKEAITEDHGQVEDSTNRTHLQALADELKGICFLNKKMKILMSVEKSITWKWYKSRIEHVYLNEMRIFGNFALKKTPLPLAVQDNAYNKKIKACKLFRRFYSLKRILFRRILLKR